MNDGTETGMWMTCSNKGHDFSYIHDESGRQRTLPPT